MALSRRRQRREAGWRKAGAWKFTEKETAPKVEGTLRKIKRLPDEWDLLPIGEKIRKIETLISVTKTPEARGREFKFLAHAGKEELDKVSAHLKERLASEKKSLDDMKSVFSHWGVDLGKLGLKPEDVSLPHGTRWSITPAEFTNWDTVLISSPAMADWYIRNVGRKGLQASKNPMGDWYNKRIEAEKAFGLGQIAYRTSWVGERTAHINAIQPLIFYKRAIKGMTAAGTSLVKSGKEGTAHTIPLKHPDILILYAHLKDARERDASKVRVYGGGEYVVDPPYKKIYDRMGKLSLPFDRKEEGRTSAIFATAEERPLWKRLLKIRRRYK